MAWYVSTHAPARGATHAVVPFGVSFTRFNPRPRARGDLCLLIKLRRIGLMFQPTPPREGRREDVNASALDWEFQPTPPREGRL